MKIINYIEDLMKPPFNRNQNQPQQKQFTGGTSVYVKHDDVNGALRRLKKILEADNRQKDLSRHEVYEKPSITRKRAKDQAKKRSKKEAQSDIFHLGTKPVGSKWMKSKRKRRRVLDKRTLLDNELKKISKSKKH